MYEHAENEGINIDESKLEELFRLPVMKVHGNKHESVLLILDKIEKINKIFLVAQKDNFEHINQIILNKKYNHEIEIIEGGSTTV